MNTAGIQKAIDDCSAAGGGTISFPAGNYLTGTIQIKSNVTLRLEDQASLLGSPNVADYRNLDPFLDGSGNTLGYSLIVAVDADHVGLEGPGTVNGQGQKVKAGQKSYTMRPFLIRFVRCFNVAVGDVHLINPGAWTLDFFQTKNILINGVSIRSRGLGMQNNDGIDLDSCTDVQIHHCDVISGDDALVIKSTSSTPSSNIVASDCTLSSQGNAIKLGTESIGGFHNITISKCQVTNTGMAGIALYAVDGGDLQSVSIGDIAINGVRVPICIRLGSRLSIFRNGDKAKPAPGVLRDVTLKNITAKKVGIIGLLISGIPGHPVENLDLENIQMDLPGGGAAVPPGFELPEKEAAYPELNMFGKTLPASGIYLRHVRGVKLQNVEVKLIKHDARPNTVFVDVQNVAPADFPSQ
jgi:polygalacturonase